METERKEPEKWVVYLLPNLMTAGNLFCGFCAVLEIFKGMMSRTTGESGYSWATHYETALFFILGAFICDMLDGRLARLGGRESAFGREFDSLADLVSFGVAPALLVFKIVLFELDRFGWLIAFLYLVCGALRLARFNVIAAQAGTGGSKEFTGFPIPAAAGLVASFTLLLLEVYKMEREVGPWKYVLVFLMIFLSFMMVSQYTYPSFKAVHWNMRRPAPVFLAVIIVLASIYLMYWVALPVLFTCYLLYGFLRPYLSRAWKKRIEDELEDEAG